MPQVRKHTRLNYCDLAQCEGICCSDGAFLQPAEVRTIRRVVAQHPEHFAHLPEDFIVAGDWHGHTGPKTNVRAHRYRAKPDHFASTRCVMADDEGKCSLQTLAVGLGRHKWAYKPMGCWLYPLELEDGRILAPPRTRRDDTNNIGKEYPGFSTFTPCGQHDRKGKVWWVTLKEELGHVRKKI
ncbi:MAG: DUF3109 family protein [Betaproteobacteria bacterium]|nr:DUF3109 family protein [Betaproteobacteria bacterium]